MGRPALPKFTDEELIQFEDELLDIAIQYRWETRKIYAMCHAWFQKVKAINKARGYDRSHGLPPHDFDKEQE